MNKYLLLVILTTILYSCNNDELIRELSPGIAWIQTMNKLSDDGYNYQSTIDETPYSMETRTDGSFFIANMGNLDFYDENGNHTETDTLEKYIRGIEVIENNSYLLFGTDTLSNDNWIAIIDISNNITWENTFSTPIESVPKLVTIVNDGYIVGSNTVTNGWVTKLDNNGNVIWQKELLKPLISLELGTEENLLVTTIPVGLLGIEVTKININGAIVWTKTIGNNTAKSAVIKQQQHEYLILVEYNSQLSNLYRLDENGNQLEVFKEQNTGAVYTVGERVSNFEILSNGNLMFLSEKLKGQHPLAMAGSLTHINIKTITPSGEPLWEMFSHISDRDYEELKNWVIRPTIDGGYLILFENEQSYYIAKVNPE